MATAIALLCALLAMMIAYQGMPVATGVRARQFDTLRGNALPDDTPGSPRWRQVMRPLNGLAGRALPDGLRRSVRTKLYWANFSNSWLGWNEVEFWSLSLAVAAAAFVLLAQDPIIALVGAFLGASMP